jgi:demethylmacrocin O-methyltransferase
VLERIVADHGRPQVVIDDGSHRPEHIRETFRLLFPLLDDDGVYAIEDTQTSYWPFWGGSMDRQDPTSTMALVKDLIDGLNYEEFLDRGYQPSYSDTHVTGVSAYHNLVFVQKGRNREGSWRHDLEQKRTYRRMRRQRRRAARAEAAASDG